MLKKSVTFLLILSFIMPFLYLPQQAPKVEAAGLPVVDIPARVERILSAIAMITAQQVIDRMVASTVKWAQSGFEGNPAYATDPRQYFTDIADGVAGEFIEGSDIGFLCSPFQANIKLSLIQNYYQPQPFQCTLTEVVGNIEGFYDNFNNGGWDAWFSMTQNPTNNPYGAYLEAKIELDSRIASAVGLEREQLNWNQGFLSWSECIETNPPEWSGTTTGTNLLPSRNTRHIRGKAVGECIQRGPTNTPGSVIKSQLDKVLPSGLEKLITAQHMDQLASAFASGLLTKYVFGSNGLFAKNSNTRRGSSGGGTVTDSRLSKIDLDGDRIPEGQDFDQDTLLSSSVDVCFHGGNPPDCVKSTTVTVSPYLTPFCESVERAVSTLTDFTSFVDSHADQMQGGASLRGQIIGGILTGGLFGVFLGGFFGSGSVDNFKNKADANIWYNRMSEVDSSINNVLRNIQNYRIPYFDNMEVAVNRFAHYTDKVLESLIKDGDLDLANVGSGGGGLANLMKNSANNLLYFKKIKTGLGKCELPNAAGLNNIPLPPEVESGGGGEPPPGGQCSATGARYAGDLRSAMNAVLEENPDVANLPNTEANNRQNARTFLALVEEKLISMGFNATDEVLNGNNNPSSGDIIAVWREGDEKMERYDAINGSASTIGTAASTQFAGFIPLNCTSSGGGTDCACENIPPPPGGGGGTPTSLLSDLQAERARYGNRLTPEELGKLLNAVAWKNRAAGWVLLGKASGNNCPSPAGPLISCDYLVHRGTLLGYDVLLASEETATPQWPSNPEYMGPSLSNGSRTLVDPVAP